MLHKLVVALLRLGGLGLLGLSLVDSSILTMPLGNDLLLVGLSARHHDRTPYYVLMATAGSILGCMSTGWVSRKGEHELERHISRVKLDYVENHLRKHTGVALVIASLMPPPFPFTPFVVGAAFLEYPRKKLLMFIGIGRLVRFSAEGVAAVHYGSRIMSTLESPTVEYALTSAVITFAVLGSLYPLYRWIRRSRRDQLGVDSRSTVHVFLSHLARHRAL